eukprot:TRINITY_DN7404_c0_g1_i1.p1 TRINITY_DN7404_c0_g1~~TRINITY_DN7404_c0_g1_i1.p1  ORF type:complete len:115 (+),score=20.09 TRINITY_DN7404_c0_g1_i1:100-444(+)
MKKKLNSEYYLSHLELSFQQPSIVPFDVRTTRSLDELKHNKAQAIKWSPKQFPGTADVIVERPTRRPTKAPDSTVTSVPFSGSSYAVSYTHLRAHETSLHLVCRLLLEKKKKLL